MCVKINGAHQAPLFDTRDVQGSKTQLNLNYKIFRGIRPGVELTALAEVTTLTVN